MNKRIYVVVTALIIALAASNVGNAPELQRVVYSIHDNVALVWCNPTQMYTCGFGSEWNASTYCYLATLICASVFVYSNSYAYPDGFRTMSILRFGSEKRYWKYTMWHNMKNVLFASTVYIMLTFVLCTVFQYSRGFGLVQFVPYDRFIIIYILFWMKLIALLSLVAIFAEVFAERLGRAGIIGIIVITIVLLLSIDVLKKKSALLAVGSSQMQIKAIVVFLLVQAVLMVYGRVRPLKI